MRRREFVALVGGAVAFAADARAQQQTANVHRLGYLASGTATGSPGGEAFRQGLLELGWVEGKNVVIDYRFAESRFDRL